MNQKKAKRARRFLRLMGVDPKQTAYVKPDMKRRVGIRMTTTGLPEQYTYEVTGTIRLAKDCGRAVYHEAKRAA